MGIVIVADSISLHPNQANMANLEVPGNQVQIQIQGSDGETLEAEPPKGILKDSRRQSKVSFNEDVEIKRSPSNTSITSDVVPRDHKDTDVSRRRSSWTQSTYSLDGGAGSTLGVLVVLKVLFVDILITGFGDAITDLLQGIYMIVEEPLNSEDTNDTIAAGIAVILICWVPGIVAILHLIASHKDEFLFLDESVDVNIRKSRRRNFFILLGLCFFFYPIVPTIGYLINLCYMTGGQDQTSHKIEMFAKVGHSISGCIEAPMQMVMVLYLVLKEYLPIPFQDDPRYVNYTDRFGNDISFIANIPVLTFIFSITNILSSAFTINLFNVYVGQFKDKDSFKRYFNLIGGHLPFFLLQISFRITSFTLILVYLDTWAAAFLIAMWLCNLIIGYVTSAAHNLGNEMRTRLQRARSVARLEANQPKIEVKGAERDTQDTPIWLNSFLSLFVPSCYMRTVDPAIFNIDKNQSDEQKEKDRKLRKRFFEKEKQFQRKVIRLQVLSSTTILLAATGLMFFLVQFGNWGYNNNILDNYAFQIACATSALLGIFSFISIGFIDIYELFGLNKWEKEVKENQKKGSRACQKTLLTIIFGLLAVAPLVAGFVFVSNTSQRTGYLSLKDYNSTHVKISLISANRLTSSGDGAVDLKEKHITMCNNATEVADICKVQEKQNNILVIDFNEKDKCEQFIHREADKEDSDCLKFSSIVFLESKDFKSSSPKQNKIKHVPVLSVHTRDTELIKDAFSKSQDVKMDIFYESLDTMMASLNGDSDLKRRGCNDLTNKQTQSAPIALEQAAAEQGELYVGGEKVNDEGKQVANVKVNSELVLTCKIYGRDCSALQVWVQQPKNKEQMKKFEVECQSPVEMIKKNFKEQRDEFTSGYSDNMFKTHRCFQRQESTVIYSRDQNENSKNCPLGIKDLANCVWGDWITPPAIQEDDPNGDICIGGDPIGRQSFRFCRMKGKDLKDCLFMEVKTMLWDVDKKTCTRKEENFLDPRTGKLEYTYCE